MSATGSTKKFRIIKRKVLNDNTSLQNTQSTGEGPDRFFKASQTGTMVPDAGQKQSFNENSFSIFDIDSGELANTFKDSSQLKRSQLRALSRTDDHIAQLSTQDNKLNSDIENVDSRLESIMSRQVFSRNHESRRTTILTCFSV